MVRLFVAVLAFAYPVLASACAVCFEADGERRVAYYVTTLVMIALPAALAIAGVLWVRSAARSTQQRPQEASAGDDAN